MQIDEDDLLFVVQHYKRNRLNEQSAWKEFSRITKNKPAGKPHRLAIAASLTLIASVILATGIYFNRRLPNNSYAPRPISTEQKTGNTSLEANDSTVVFHFADKPINSVLTELGTYFGKNLSANDTTKRITGEMEISTLEEATNILECTLNIIITVE